MSQEREPLRNRVNGEWTVLEMMVFNAIGKAPEDGWPELLFSGRLRLAEAALRGVDAELELMRAEIAARLPRAGRI